MKKVIGVDIGGTKISGGIIDEDGRLLAEKTLPTDAGRGREGIHHNLSVVIDAVIGPDILGIGVGSAGRINYVSGTVDYATSNLPGWTGFFLRDEIHNRYGLPVVVDNDVNAAGVGEFWVGAGRTYRNMMMITLGTGIGGAIIHEGELIRGSHWSTGEIGHMILYPHGRKCNCGRDGCLERYASGNALFNRYNELSHDKKAMNAKEIFRLFEEGDGIAKRVIDEFIDAFSLALTSLRHIIDPEVFIIGGGLMEAKHLWWDSLRESLNPDINICAAELGARATITGAGKLILTELRSGTLNKP